MLPSNLGLGNPSGLFPSGFPTKMLYAFLYSQVRACICTYSIFAYWNLQIIK
jgi:hypothetical protein